MLVKDLQISRRHYSFYTVMVQQVVRLNEIQWYMTRIVYDFHVVPPLKNLEYFSPETHTLPTLRDKTLGWGRPTPDTGKTPRLTVQSVVDTRPSHKSLRSTKRHRPQGRCCRVVEVYRGREPTVNI